MIVVGLHKTSSSITQINEVTSITVDSVNITVTGILASQTTPSTWTFPRNLWYVRILES